MEHYNKLTPLEAERLALVAEECGELVQAICKALRHGLDSVHPLSGVSNRDDIAREAGQVIAVIRILIREQVIPLAALEDANEEKLATIDHYLHHFSD